MAKLKLKFDFDTSKCLEVYQETLKDWFRVTANEFRSWNGKRRITTGNISQDYNGPIYIFETNTIAINLEKSGIIFVDGDDPRIFGCRPGERHLVEKLKQEGHKQDYKNIKIR